MLNLGLSPALQGLRLLAIPVFCYAAWLDYRTRRIPRRLWVPLMILGAVVTLSAGAVGMARALVSGEPLSPASIAVLVSTGLLTVVAIGFTETGLLGRADGFALVAVGLLFPTRTALQLGGAGGAAQASADGTGLVLPVLLPPPGVPLSLVIFKLGAFVGGLSIAVVAWRNLRAGALSVRAIREEPGRLARGLTARRVHWEELLTMEGSVVAAPGDTTDADAGTVPAATTAPDDDGVGSAAAARLRRATGFDLDVLRMYCRWRGVPLTTLRANAAAYRQSTTLPADPNPPTDGRVDPALDPDPAHGVVPATDRDAPTPAGPAATEEDRGDIEPAQQPVGDEPAPVADASAAPTATDSEVDHAAASDDPWGAAAFVADVDHTYGKTAADLRVGLDRVTAVGDATDAGPAYWVSVGLPFLVPLTVGLVLAVTVGNIV